jgi:hypothetical protein
LKLKIPYWYLLLGPTFLFYLGGLFNLGVMALNHGQMPVLIPTDIASQFDFDARHVLMTSATHLKFFCDWLSLGDGVASPGDLLLWLSQSISAPCLAVWVALMIKESNEGKTNGRW